MQPLEAPKVSGYSIFHLDLSTGSVRDECSLASDLWQLPGSPKLQAEFSTSGLTNVEEFHMKTFHPSPPDSVRRTQDMSGSASFQMHPKSLGICWTAPLKPCYQQHHPAPNPFPHISSSFRILLPASPPSSLFSYPSPFSYPLPTSSSLSPFHVMLASSSHHYCTPISQDPCDKFIRLMGQALSPLLYVRKSRPNFEPNQWGVKKKKKKKAFTVPLTDHETEHSVINLTPTG